MRFRVGNIASRLNSASIVVLSATAIFSVATIRLMGQRIDSLADRCERLEGK